MEEEVLTKRLSKWSLQRLQEEGYTLAGLSAFWLSEAKFGRPVAAFMLGAGMALPNHLFRCFGFPFWFLFPSDMNS